MDRDFGHYIAGYIDGEGCFTIEDRRSGPPYLYPHFGLAVRADDSAIVEAIHAAVGFGRIFQRRAYGKAKPQIVWKFAAHDDCERLVKFLTRFPLRAKKAKDFAIWREAVAIQAKYVEVERYELLLPLREQLMAGRRYTED